MKLQTTVHLSRPNVHLIDYESDVLFLGSCFSENIGEKLDYHKFRVTQNPFGILFHPLAIENYIQKSTENYKFSERDINLANELWYSFEAHSKLNSTSKEDLILNLNKAVESGHQSLHKASHIFITLGTAWVFRHLETDKIVANCHKVPQREFRKELLSIQQIKQSFESSINTIKKVNPHANIVFTVSPVRHIRNGLTENNRSKAHLLAAVHEVVDLFQNTFYFPSYEIQMDELRDYRFYADDLIHPNDLAIAIIFEKFKSTWINPAAYPIMKEVDLIQKGLQHKPFHENSESHKKFKKELLEKIKNLQALIPHLEF